MRWQRTIDAALRPLGLTHTQYLVLASAASVVREHGDAVAQLAIAESAGLDNATISTLVRKLEGRGLLDRSADTSDRRRWRVMLTPRGKNLLQKAASLVDEAAAGLAPRRDPAEGHVGRRGNRNANGAASRTRTSSQRGRGVAAGSRRAR